MPQKQESPWNFWSRLKMLGEHCDLRVIRLFKVTSRIYEKLVLFQSLYRQYYLKNGLREFFHYIKIRIIQGFVFHAYFISELRIYEAKIENV